jgi:hypothetical protein
MKHIPFGVRAGTALMVLAALGACRGGASSDASADGEAAEGAFTVEQGEWEMTTEITEVSMEGFPERMRDQVRELEREAQTQRTCVPVTFSVDSLRLLNMRFSIPRNGNCNIAEITAENGQLRSRISCSGLPEDMSLSSEVDGEYDEDSYSMTFRADVDIEGQDRKGSIEGRVRGRRVGDCESSRRMSPTPPPMMMNESMGSDMGTMGNTAMPPPSYGNMATNAM